MKRDIELARLILLEIEKQSTYLAEIKMEFDGYTEEQTYYHVMLLHEAGLLIALDSSGMGDLYWIPQRLTWQGHEFLDASRNSHIWEKVKYLMAKSGGFVFEVAKPLLIKMIEQELFTQLK